MEITGEQYCVIYDSSTATVTLQGILRLCGAAGYFSIDDFTKHRERSSSVQNGDAPATAASLVELFEIVLTEQRSKIIVDLRELELLNSAGINALSKFVIKVRENQVNTLIIKVTEQFFWQNKILRNLQKLMPGLIGECN